MHRVACPGRLLCIGGHSVCVRAHTGGGIDDGVLLPPSARPPAPHPPTPPHPPAPAPDLQIAPCYVFLASDDGSYFSGQVGLARQRRWRKSTPRGVALADALCMQCGRLRAMHPSPSPAAL